MAISWGGDTIVFLKSMWKNEHEGVWGVEKWNGKGKKLIIKV